MLNPSDIRLEDLNPELSMQVDSMWKQYQDTYKDRAPVASVSSSADQNNTPLNENNSVNALAM